MHLKRMNGVEMRSLMVLLIVFSFMLHACKDSGTNYQKGDQFFKDKNYTMAIKYYQASINQGVKKDADLFYQLSYSHYALKKYPEAEEYIKKALEISPENDKYILLQADVKMALKKYFVIIDSIKKLPDSFDKYKRLTDLYLLANSIQDAVFYLDKTLKYIEGSTEQEKKALIKKFKKQFSHKLINMHFNCTPKNRFFSKVYPELKEDNQFLKDYYKVLICKYKDGTENKEVIFKYDKTLEKRNTVKIEVLESILKQTRGLYYINELAQLYIKKGKLKEARALIKESKQINAKQDIILFLEAQVHFQRERYEAVTAKLREYIKRNKEIGAYELLALSEYMLNNNFMSIKYYNELVKMNKYEKEYLLQLLKLYKRVGDEEKIGKTEHKIKFFYRNFYK